MLKRAIVCVVAAALTGVAGPAWSAPFLIVPDFRAEAVDFAPQDGIGDLFNPAGSSRVANLPDGLQVRVFAEYNISSLSGPVASATWQAIPTQDPTTAQISLYGRLGDGIPSPSDYSLGTLIGPLVFNGGSYQVDITGFLNTLLSTNPHEYLELHVAWTGAPSLVEGGVGQQAIFGLTAETPVPGALPLFASGLGALGLIAWRKKRKAVAATLPA